MTPADYTIYGGVCMCDLLPGFYDPNDDENGED